VIANHSEPLPAGPEAAWATWSAGIAKVDARTVVLLKAALDAGAEAAKRKTH
jgi:hypothetical protein